MITLVIQKDHQKTSNELNSCVVFFQRNSCVLFWTSGALPFKINLEKNFWFFEIIKSLKRKPKERKNKNETKKK